MYTVFFDTNKSIYAHYITNSKTTCSTNYKPYINHYKPSLKHYERHSYNHINHVLTIINHINSPYDNHVICVITIAIYCIMATFPGGCRSFSPGDVPSAQRDLVRALGFLQGRLLLRPLGDVMGFGDGIPPTNNGIIEYGRVGDPR